MINVRILVTLVMSKDTIAYVKVNIFHIYNIISNKKGEKVKAYGLWFISSANDEANNDPRT